MKDFDTMLLEITKECKDCGQIPLGPSCGKYYNIFYDYDEDLVVANMFWGATGYSTRELRMVSENILRKIYNEVFQTS